MKTLQLCDTGKALYERYCLLASEDSNSARAADAWNDWALHRFGCADRKGCKECRIKQTQNTQYWGQT